MLLYKFTFVQFNVSLLSKSINNNNKNTTYQRKTVVKYFYFAQVH